MPISVPQYLSTSAPRFFRAAATGAALALAVAGCGGTVSEPDTAEQTQEAKGHGPIAAVKSALAELELSSAARAKVDAAVGDVEQKLEPVRAARLALAQDVAGGVRAGRIDHARIETRTKEIAAGVKAAVPTIESALGTLHATLDADQREELLDSLRDGFRDRRGHPGERLREIADELGLDDEQRDRIKDAVKAKMMAKRDEHRSRFGEMRERAREAAEAFESERFDPKMLELDRRAPEAAKRFAEGVVEMVEVALPHLTPQQRSKLAEIIERKADES
jgi:Spy/CpxP family protein refolding chaperone